MINVIASLDAVYTHITGVKVKSDTVSEAVRRFELIGAEVPEINKLYDDKGALLVECLDAVVHLKAAMTLVQSDGGYDVIVGGNQTVGTFGYAELGAAGGRTVSGPTYEVYAGEYIYISSDDDIDMYSMGDTYLGSTGEMDFYGGAATTLDSADTLQLSCQNQLTISTQHDTHLFNPYGHLTLEAAEGVRLLLAKRGASQVSVGAVANELWIDSADNSVKIGV
jgi:hypothetical protein